MAKTVRKQRFNISVPGRFRSGTGAARDVEVLDISERGCRFFDRFGRLQEGVEITLRVGTIGPIVSIVRWREGNVVGVEFESPIYEPVLYHIRDRLSANRELPDWNKKR